MKTRALLFVVFTIALFALGVLITTLFNTSPGTKDALAMFYVSTFLFLFGLVFFGGYAFIWLRAGGAPVGQPVFSLIRSTLIFDLFLLAILLMRSSGVLDWATSAVLLAAAVILTLVIRKRIA